MIATKPSNQPTTIHGDKEQNRNRNSCVLPHGEDIFAGLNLPSAPSHPIVVDRLITAIPTNNILTSPSTLLSRNPNEIEPQFQISASQFDLNVSNNNDKISLVQFDDASDTINKIPNSFSSSSSIPDILISALPSQSSTAAFDTITSSPSVETALPPISASYISLPLSAADLSKLYVTTEYHQRSQMNYPVLPTLYSATPQPSSSLPSLQQQQQESSVAGTDSSNKRTNQTQTSTSIDAMHNNNNNDNTINTTTTETFHSHTEDTTGGTIVDTSATSNSTTTAALVDDLVTENTKLSQELENLRQVLKMQQEQGMSDAYYSHPLSATTAGISDILLTGNQHQTPIIGHIVYPSSSSSVITTHLPTNMADNRYNHNNTTTMPVITATPAYNQTTSAIRVHENAYRVSNNNSSISNNSISNTNHSFVIPLAVTSSSSSSSSGSNSNSHTYNSADRQYPNIRNMSTHGQYAALSSVEDEYDSAERMSGMSESDRISLINNTNFYTSSSNGINGSNISSNTLQQQRYPHHHHHHHHPSSQLSSSHIRDSVDHSTTTATNNNTASTMNNNTYLDPRNMTIHRNNINTTTTTNTTYTNAAINTTTATATDMNAVKYVCCGHCHQWLTAPFMSNYVYCPSCESINQCDRVPVRPANAPVYLEHQQQYYSQQTAHSNVPWLFVPLYDCMRGMFT